MKPPPPLLIAAIGAAVALIGLLLWRSQGARIWLQDAIAWCF